MLPTLDPPRVCPKSVPAASPPRRRRAIAFALFLAAYFAYFSRYTLAVHFAPDEMMNLATYWRIKPLTLLLAQVMPWRPFYRPMVGLLDLSLFSLFGLNPAPYHAALLLVLFANACLTWRLASLLGAGRPAAGLAAIAVCYHAGINNLYYNTAFTYDAVCCFFYLAALAPYVHVRGQGRIPGVRATLAVLMLYLCALNSKEMALTFPAILLVYECLYHPRLARGSLRAWLRGPGRVLLPAALLVPIFSYGHLFRAGGLMDEFAYRPAFTGARLIDFQIRSLDDLLIRPHPLDPLDVAVFWILLTYLAWRRARPILRLCWWMAALAPLPIEFLPGRAGACLAIPSIALAIFAAVTAVDLAHAAAGFLAGERAFAPLGRRNLFAAVLLAGASLWAWHNADLQIRYVASGMRQLGQPTWDAIQQFRALRPKLSRDSSLVFLNDPFEGFDMEFIAELLIRDRTVRVWLARKAPLDPDEIARAERIFDYRQGKLVQVR